MLNRRQFLATSAGLLAINRAGYGQSGSSVSNPFTLGVASGCPRSDQVVLWTRLAPDPLRGGGMGMDDVLLRLRLCRDEQMQDSLIDELVIAYTDDGHSVHFIAAGLEPGREYWYQFYLGEDASPIGRTRTAPAQGSQEPLRLAVASCQHYETGLFAAYADMTRMQPDLVIHLGDYIYEYGPGGADRIRQHSGDEITTLWDYRNRHAQYRLDPQLQEAHAASPWLVSPDDHEIDNNWAGYTPQDPEQQTELEFKVRRWAALKAYYEHMPLERRPVLTGLESELRIYDAFDFGDLLRIVLMDTRQYRSDQPCSQAFPSAPNCAQRFNEELTMTGQAQERFIGEALSSSNQRWNLLAQQTWFTPFRYPGDQYNMGQWDGYAVQRRRLQQRLTNPALNNPVVLSGDWHCGNAMNVPADLSDPTSRPVAAELATTSISSACPWIEAVQAALPENPQSRYFSGDRRGYLLCDIGSSAIQAQYRLVEDPARDDSAVTADAELQIEEGRRGFVA